MYEIDFIYILCECPMFISLGNIWADIGNFGEQNARWLRDQDIFPTFTIDKTAYLMGDDMTFEVLNRATC